MKCLQEDGKISKTNTVHIVTYLLKTKTVETKETVTAREWFCKHISTATNSCDSSNTYTCNNKITVGTRVYYVVHTKVI
jgi:hypothetical protein